MKTAAFITLALSLSLISIQSHAAQFYRWIDAQGNTFIQSYIPPESVTGGYEIIDDAGIVIKTVAPQISDAEREAADSARLSAEMQRARDLELLKLYRSPKDVDRSMNTWLSRMDMEARLKRNRIRIKENEYDSFQATAANQERIGQEVDPELVQELAAISLEIAKYGREIRSVEQRQAASRADFMLDRNRMVILWELINKKKWQDPATEKP
ncbi:DUF4124 domain-containing protein [Reinekea sp.]|jgi:hypothetical protein|uniref:DUF4124 domain-containing protein n=1 Tax=Reinekea sp. TaxID=1970455 RepID=UPI002A810E19|nr:DUF4124 domain-containing protein [Reinekea sp.]